MSIEDSKIKVGNPLWVPGKSGNPEGRKKMKHSALTLMGKTERLLNGYLGSKLFKKDFNNATGKERLDWSTKIAGIVIPKAQANTLSVQEVEELYKKLESKVISDATKKVS